MFIHFAGKMVAVLNWSCLSCAYKSSLGTQVYGKARYEGALFLWSISVAVNGAVKNPSKTDAPNFARNSLAAIESSLIFQLPNRLSVKSVFILKESMRCGK